MNVALHLLVSDVPPRPWAADLALDQRDHLNFVVADIEAATAALQAHGVAYLRLWHPDLAIMQVFCADPDGNVIELGSCAVPPGLVGCEGGALSTVPNLTPTDVHPVVRDTFGNPPTRPR